MATILFYLDQFDNLGLIARHFLTSKGLFASYSSTARRPLPACQIPAGSSTYTLSRFAFIRRAAGGILLESPVAGGVVSIHDSRVLQWLFILKDRVTYADAVAELLTHDVIAADDLARLLISVGFVSEVTQAVPAMDDRDGLAQWEFHDLLFHSRSRDGRHGNRYGGSYPWLGWTPSAPACRTSHSASSLQLEVPTTEDNDPALFATLAGRRSIRDYSSLPVTFKQIGDFLARTSRVSDFFPGDDELTRRPYPSGGARYPLELYLLSWRCDGLRRGLYHYDALHHSLSEIKTAPADLAVIHGDVATYANRPAKWEAQVVIIFSARFRRMSWKYESVAYSLILKEVGVLMQTMYLVATAMHLSPCAVGGGDSDLFAQLAGLDYYEETAVGEFLLGN